MKFELLIENKGVIQMPLVMNGITWTTERKGTPGKLTFSIVKDEKANFLEGNPVRLTVDDQKVFYGFVFSKKRNREQQIGVTAYDQLRYLMIKDTCVYMNKTASDVIQMVVEDLQVQLGTIEQTSFIIPTRNEDNISVFEMINNALDLEVTNKRQMFILYDDFGKITLKSLDNMKIGLVIDEETGENFDYSSTIDDNTYNRIKLAYENNDTGKREIYVVQDGNNISNWGVLQYFDKLKQGENGEAKAQALLDLYNVKTRKLKITKAFGDVRVRGGSLIIVKLALGDVNVQNYMVVEKATHTFNESEHYMDLTLRGGEFVG